MARELHRGLQHRLGRPGTSVGELDELAQRYTCRKAFGVPEIQVCAITTFDQIHRGAIRVEPDRHHITLPRLGTIHTHESTRTLVRRIEAGTARILSATVVQDSTGRWYCSFQTIVSGKARPAHAARSRHPVVGIDVGVRNLLVVAAPDGTELARIRTPRALVLAQSALRVLQRRAAHRQGPYDQETNTRRIPSRRWRTAQARIGKAHARAARVRRDVLHKATTAFAQQHQVVVVETLAVAGMRSGGGARKRGLNRALADAALAEVRRMLTYKTRWYSSTIVQADRFYPSSKLCSGCGGRKPNLPLAERTYSCEHCGLSIDRDRNAAVNLARLGGTGIGSRPTADHRVGEGRGATRKTGPAQTGTAAGAEASTRHDGTDNGGDMSGTVPPQGEAA
ncbi:RNA-guided endonuclease TnpB family protein [Nocardia asteroides]|uniref:RNA-guided endonuclease TnpB family protein n=1 Tax=Nocardia asteroides TaxID=1824 RepID=UPI003400A512